MASAFIESGLPSGAAVDRHHGWCRVSRYMVDVFVAAGDEFAVDGSLLCRCCRRYLGIFRDRKDRWHRCCRCTAARGHRFRGNRGCRRHHRGGCSRRRLGDWGCVSVGPGVAVSSVQARRAASPLVTIHRFMIGLSKLIKSPSPHLGVGGFRRWLAPVAPGVLRPGICLERHVLRSGDKCSAPPFEEVGTGVEVPIPDLALHDVDDLVRAYVEVIELSSLQLIEYSDFRISWNGHSRRRR